MESITDAHEALHLINRFYNEKCRIFWITEEFNHDTFEELYCLANKGKSVRLTHGGWTYYYGVLDEFDYMLEALCFFASFGKELFSKRIRMALRSLEVMLQLSLNENFNLSKENMGTWRSIQHFVIGDIIIGSTPGLARAAKGHFNKMQQPEVLLSSHERYNESLSTRNVVIDWCDLLHKLDVFGCEFEANINGGSIDKNLHLVPLGRTGSFRSLGPAVGCFQYRQKAAVDIIETMLKGQELWLDRFGSDNYHIKRLIGPTHL